jgi:nicotinamidase-related amidase
MYRLGLAFALSLGLSIPVASEDATNERLANRPKVPGKLRLRMQKQQENPPGSGQFQPKEVVVDWNTAETAIIVCDMWDGHYCKIAGLRVVLLVPKMNQVLSLARDHGVMIIHAPSSTMDVYADTPYRKRMQQAKPVKPPVPIARWCDLDPAREPPLPIDTSKCACDDPVVAPVVRKYTRQHEGLDIIGFDGISDSGEEIYSFCQQEGITNIVMMGVNTNMCVLGRSFGIRQLVKLGLNVVLVRDLTDAMYDPRQPPYVSHARGTELSIEHIEKYWCPSILSEDLTRVVRGSAGPFKEKTAGGK